MSDEKSKSSAIGSDYRRITPQDVFELSQEFGESMKAHGAEIVFDQDCNKARILYMNVRLEDGHAFPISEPATRENAQKILSALQESIQPPAFHTP